MAPSLQAREVVVLAAAVAVVARAEGATSAEKVSRLVFTELRALLTERTNLQTGTGRKIARKAVRLAEAQAAEVVRAAAARTTPASRCVRVGNPFG